MKRWALEEISDHTVGIAGLSGLSAGEGGLQREGWKTSDSGK